MGSLLNEGRHLTYLLPNDLGLNSLSRTSMVEKRCLHGGTEAQETREHGTMSPLVIGNVNQLHIHKWMSLVIA